MENYGKILLYSYKKLGKLAKEIEKLVNEKAVGSFYSPYDCERIAEDIIRLENAKEIILITKEKMDKALKQFSEQDLLMFEYRYFKSVIGKLPKPMSNDRQYFREQRRLYVKFLSAIKSVGLTEEWFNENCLKLRYFADMCELYNDSRL